MRVDFASTQCMTQPGNGSHSLNVGVTRHPKGMDGTKLVLV